MNEKGIDVLQQYDLDIIRTSRVRGAVLCETRQGSRLLKEYRGTQGSGSGQKSYGQDNRKGQGQDNRNRQGQGSGSEQRNHEGRPADNRRKREDGSVKIPNRGIFAGKRI